MAFNFPAFSYIVALIIDAFLIFFAIFHVIAFDELRTDYKNPIDQCNSLNPLVLPEYLLHLAFNVLFVTAGEWFSLCLNIPLLAYHVNSLLDQLKVPSISKKSTLEVRYVRWHGTVPCEGSPSTQPYKYGYRTRPVMTAPGLYDPTSIMNADVLTKCQREGWIKLAFYLLSFFYYLYGMIYALIST